MRRQNDARLSVKEVAAAVGLAPSSAHGRIRQLREAGVLRGAHAEVDPRALGIGLEALLMIGLSKHKREPVDRFLDDAVSLPEAIGRASWRERVGQYVWIWVVAV